MDPHAQSHFNTQIYEEACAWFVECRSGDLDAAARTEFDRWLRKSPEHLSAYVEIAAIWNEGPSLDPTNKWDIDTLTRQAARDTDNVVALPGMSLEFGSQRAPTHDVPSDLPNHALAGNGEAHEELCQKRPRSHAYRSRWRWSAIAASVAVLGSIAGMVVWEQLRVPTYVTAIGEQRSIELADGSTVELNSRSKIKVRYSEHERDVELLEGQALFHVAKSHGRPFVVSADGTRVRAVGTQFDVYKKHIGTLVTVIEGRVAIFTTPVTPGADTLSSPGTPASKEMDSAVIPNSSPPRQMEGTGAQSTRATAGVASGTGGAIYLSGGEQLTVSAQTSQKTDHPNIEGATAWRQRQIVFESASLADVAEEFNRYNQRQLVIEDTGLYDFHISGVFSSTDPDSLLRFLRERPGVHVTESPSEIRVSKNSGQRG